MQEFTGKGLNLVVKVQLFANKFHKKKVVNKNPPRMRMLFQRYSTAVTTGLCCFAWTERNSQPRTGKALSDSPCSTRHTIIRMCTMQPSPPLPLRCHEATAATYGCYNPLFSMCSLSYNMTHEWDLQTSLFVNFIS